MCTKPWKNIPVQRCILVPAIDFYKENVIYVNKAQTAELYPTLAHEGYPGHLYQNVYYAARRMRIRYAIFLIIQDIQKDMQLM